MQTLSVLNKQGKEAGKLELPEKLFGKHVNKSAIYQALVMYRASLRQGTVDTKERGEVSGGGKKPWRQKGTGRARHGSIRSPLWKGGGVTFGPHPRDFGYSIPQKMKTLALRESLTAKYKSHDLLCVDELADKFKKTKEFVKVLNAWKAKGKVLALLDGCDPSVFLASRNVPRFEMMRAEDVNAYDILRNKTLVITKSAFNKLIKRINK